MFFLARLLGKGKIRRWTTKMRLSVVEGLQDLWFRLIQDCTAHHPLWILILDYFSIYFSLIQARLYCLVLALYVHVTLWQGKTICATPVHCEGWSHLTWAVKGRWWDVILSMSLCNWRVWKILGVWLWVKNSIIRLGWWSMTKRLGPVRLKLGLLVFTINLETWRERAALDAPKFPISDVVILLPLADAWIFEATAPPKK